MKFYKKIKVNTADIIKAANELINNPLYRNELISIAERVDAEALLIIIRNIDENILEEVSRLTKCYPVFAKN